jgi:hypothetical protein
MNCKNFDQYKYKKHHHGVHPSAGANGRPSYTNAGSASAATL